MNGESAAALLALPRPELTPENALVIAAWNFCGGWNPGLVGAAAAYYGIADVDFLIGQLLAVRDCMSEHREALEKSGSSNA